MLSVRLTNEEFEQLVVRATQIGVGPSTLARTLLRSGLQLDTAPRRRADPSEPLTPSQLEQELKHRLSQGSPQSDLEQLAQRVAALEARVDAIAEDSGARKG